MVFSINHLRREISRLALRIGSRILIGGRHIKRMIWNKSISISHRGSIIRRHYPWVGSSMPTWTRLSARLVNNRLNHSLDGDLNNSKSGIRNSIENNSSIGSNNSNSIDISSDLMSAKVLHDSIHISLEPIHLSLELGQGFLVGSIFLFNHDLLLFPLVKY